LVAVARGCDLWGNDGAWFRSRVWGPIDQADVSGVARTRVGPAGRRGPIG